MKQTRVLVTGAGSGVGQGILKALRIARYPLSIISADISPFNAALYRADEALLIPKVEEPDALAKFISIIRSNRIDVIMVGSEFDLNFFAHHKAELEKETGCVVIASPSDTVAIADDKWLTAEFLRTNGLPHARSSLPADAREALLTADRWGYPIMLKTRHGTSNRHVHVIRDCRQLESLYPQTPHPMLQEMIALPDKELNTEYTCSVFRTREGELIGPFTGRRTLKGGSSWVIEVDHFTELHPLLLSIGKHLPIVGSLNVQLMQTKSGPIPFEFNARFSGTTAVRAHFGFNEPEMALTSFYFKEPVAPPQIRKGMTFRYLEEVFLEGVSASELGPPFCQGIVKGWF